MHHFFTVLVCGFFGLAIGTPYSASVGGKMAPDQKTEIAIDLPGSLHLKNTVGSDGSGLCVFTSAAHSARWQHVKVLEDFQTWMKKYPGGGWPDKLAKMIAKVSKERGVPEPQFVQAEGKAECIEIIQEALKSGRMPCVTYSFSPTGRYRGGKISHMVNCVHHDGKHVCILDNNYPGDDKYEWMTPDEFMKTFTAGRSGWVFVLLDGGPPPLPFN